MMRFVLPMFLILQYALAPLTFAGVLADQRNSIAREVESCRHAAAFAVGMALLPSSVLVVPLLTGFYEKGFQWSCPDPDR